MIQHCRDLSSRRIGIPSHTELRQCRPDIEVGSLADHSVVFKHKDDDQGEVDFAAGCWKPSPAAVVCSSEPAFDDHRIVCVMHVLRIETEVGESLLVLVQERVDSSMAIPYLPGGDDLISRLSERCYAPVEFVRVLGLHVLEDRRLTPLS